jgi:hypothetical protein
VLLHPVAGLVVLAAVLFVMFQAVFSWAEAPMDWIDGAMAQLGEFTAAHLPAGPLASLLVNGVIAGAGSVLVFLPQILILFLFILALEDSGYLPRAAYLLDRLMGGVGLSGRAFIPLLSSFACAIPGIMATRTIPNWRDRLTTIMIAPLMTCSARLPVYALLISALIPREAVGPFNLQGLVMFVLYLAGIVSALIVAWVMKQFAGKRQYSPLMLELPDYQWPHAGNLLLGLWERVKIFLSRVGGIILALMIVLWFLSSYPAPARRRHRATYPVQLRRKTRRAAPVPVRADRLQLADLDRAGAGAGGARSRGGCTRHRVRDVRGRKRCRWPARAGDREHLEPGNRLFVAGVVCVRAAMPVDAGRGEARNQLVALSAHHGGLPVRAGLPGIVRHLSRHRGLGVRFTIWRRKFWLPASSPSQSWRVCGNSCPRAGACARCWPWTPGPCATHSLARWRERSLKPRIVRAAGTGCAGCAANVGTRPHPPPR